MVGVVEAVDELAADEDVQGEAGDQRDGARVGGGAVAGGGQHEVADAQLAEAGQAHRGDAVLRRGRRVHGLVLEVELGYAQRRGQLRDLEARGVSLPAPVQR
jgi:hypothetical protein